MTKCLILSIEEWAETKNKEKIVVEKINLKIGEFTCVEPISLINTFNAAVLGSCLLYTSPSPRDSMTSRMPSSA